MKKQHWSRAILLFITAIILFPVALSAQEEEEEEEPPPYDGPIYIRPKSGHLPLKLEAVEEFIDGNTSFYTRFTCALFEGQSSAYEGWSVAKANASLGLSRQFKSNNQILFYVWKKDDAYMPDIQMESLIAFAEGIKKLYPGAIEILNQEDGFNPQNGIQSPFNSVTKMVSYTYTNPSNQEVTRFDNLMLFTEDAFIEIVIKAPAEDIASATKIMSHFLNGMTY